MWTGFFGMNRKQWTDAELTDLAEMLAASLARAVESGANQGRGGNTGNAK